MKSDEIASHIKLEAEKLALHLVSVAPWKTGEYATNFKVATGLDIMERDRSAAFVLNDSRYATALEVGSWNIKNPPAPMTKALSRFHA